MHQLETTDTTAELSSSSNSEEEKHLCTILQLGDKSRKFLFTTNVNEVNIDMELHAGVDRSTVPWALIKMKSSEVYKLLPCDVTLHQYDRSHLNSAR